MNLEYLLEEGSTGNEVTILQQKLKILGYYTPTVTGSFGPDTTLAVRWFQQNNNLPVTGVVNNETWDLLFELTPSPFPSPKAKVTRPTLRRGDTGEDVKELQRSLTQLMFYNGEINGDFDLQTENAVKAFQANNKLTADGIVGINTWNALNYLYSPLAICGNTSQKPDDNNANNKYIVKKGDTLYSIARTYGTTVDAIKSANNLTSNTLQIGQELTIPGNSNQQSYVNYIVQRGDTLYSIAKKYNTTVNDITRLNNLTSNVLSIGQQLKIPTSSTPSITYTVKAGDTLYSIARLYDTTVNNIINLNNLASSVLSIGQQLKIK